MNSLFNVLLAFAALFLVKMAVTMLGWSLFMVPVFGLPPLTLWQAFGFTLLVSSLSPSSSVNIKS